MLQPLFDIKLKKSKEYDWSFKDYPKEKNGLKVFSCFAGAGGSTMGYKLAGCDVIGCLEIDEKMNNVYLENHKPKYNYCMDIRDFNKIPKKELPEELFNLDILDGSPPCSTFSVVGKREKSWGQKRKFREGQKEQTLDDLFFEFIKTVDKLQPKLFIAENVTGLIKGNAIKYHEQIFEKARKIGYKVACFLVKGETLGLPQKRHRIFYIGSKEKDYTRLNLNFNFTPVLYKEIMGGKRKPLDKNTQQYEIIEKALPFEKGISETTMRLGLKEKFDFAYVDRGDIVPTIIGSPRIIYLPEQAFLSVGELIKASSFPKDFNFLSESYRGITYTLGMGVPPLMIKRVVKRIIKFGI